jgi:hypothetical protein
VSSPLVIVTLPLAAVAVKERSPADVTVALPRIELAVNVL